jgi:GNAT superfamily N-acetyltransferase
LPTRSSRAPRRFGQTRRVGSISVRRLGLDDVGLVASIDRSEHVEVGYCVVAGNLRERPVTMVDIPPWDTEGDGPFSVAHQIDVCTDLVRNGAVLLAAFDGEKVLGLAVVDPSFEPLMGWLAFLHVTAAERRRGAATALWNAAGGHARASGSQTLYVSATPTGSAVGFYLRQGCRLADPAHPALWAKEPEDIHLVCPLR